MLPVFLALLCFNPLFASPYQLVHPSLPDDLALCVGPYDCTSHQNELLESLGRVESVSACHEACLENPRCRYQTYNYAGSQGNYPGGCFLFASCGFRHLGDGQWISVPRTCELSDSYHISPPYNLLDSTLFNGMAIYPPL